MKEAGNYIERDFLLSKTDVSIDSASNTVESDLSLMDVRPSGGTSMDKLFMCWKPSKTSSNAHHDNDSDSEDEDTPPSSPTSQVVKAVQEQQEEPQLLPTKLGLDEPKTLAQEAETATEAVTETVVPEATKSSGGSSILKVLLLVLAIIAGMATITASKGATIESIRAHAIIKTHAASSKSLDWLNDKSPAGFVVVRTQLEKIQDCTKPPPAPVEVVVAKKPKRKRRILFWKK